MLTKRLPNTIITTVRDAIVRQSIRPGLALPKTIVREMSAMDVGEDDLGFFIWAACRPDGVQTTEGTEVDWKPISIPSSMHPTVKEARMRKGMLRIVYQNNATMTEVNFLQMV